MPRGLSQTVLPAERVAKACKLALETLLEERDQSRRNIQFEWLATWIKKHPYRRLFQGTGSALAEMPEHWMMWKEYRKDDEAVLRALGALCEAATDMNAEFTVEMTADDFRLIRIFYNKEQA